jgi:hypothetical protein
MVATTAASFSFDSLRCASSCSTSATIVRRRSPSRSCWAAMFFRSISMAPSRLLVLASLRISSRMADLFCSICLVSSFS